MPGAPEAPKLEREFGPAIFPRRWIIWDPIPDWLDLRPEVLRQIFVIELDIEKEHLAVEQRKIDMVRELFMK
jgi:hypothetical protein